jgi:hypothetical protein
MAEVCATCKAPVLWVSTEQGKRMPVDAERTERGNIVLSHRGLGEPPVAVLLRAEQIEQLRSEHERSPQPGPLRLFTSHFAHCPNAAEHRDPRKRTAAGEGGRSHG